MYRPHASSPVTTSIKMFHPENDEIKTAGAPTTWLRGLSLILQ